MSSNPSNINSVWRLESASELNVNLWYQTFASYDLYLKDEHFCKSSFTNDKLRVSLEVHSEINIGQ